VDGDECRRQLAWQAARLAGLEPLGFTGDRPRPRLPATRGARAEVPLPAALVAALRGVAAAAGTTLFTVLLAAFATLLHRCTGGGDLPIAIPVANRGRAEYARTVGLFVNTLLLRVPCAADQSFAALVADVHALAAAAYANQEAPFDRVVQGLRAQRDPANPGFANVMFDYQDESALVLPIPGVRAEFFELDKDTAILDVVLTAHLGPAGSACSVRYATDLYDAATMERLLGHFLTLLGGIAAAPRSRLDALPLLGAEELALVTRTWNDTAAPFPQDACLHTLFADQAARTPERTALICGDRQLTYRELERAANRLANRLVAACAGPERLVGILLDRSIDLVVAILAALASGAGYVPLDRKAGAPRLAWIARDARLVAVVAHDEHAARLPAGTSVLHPHRDAGSDDTAPQSGVHAGNVAYVIYTSGSSGDPKGVVVEHRSAVNAVLATIARYRDLAVDRTLFQSSVTFDSSVSKILQSLCNGGQLIVAPEDADFAAVLELTARHGIARLTPRPPSSPSSTTCRSASPPASR
jgi:non-ribosomal peptide synthetase component F